MYAKLLILAASLLAVSAVSANPGKPNFTARIYADGEVFGTKGATALPAPLPFNLQSFDGLYVITNSNNPQGQLPIAESAPGGRDYNGGRWFTHTVEWTEEGFLAHGIVPVLTSEDEMLFHASLQHLVITPGSFPDGPPVYFECPLLPAKDE